MKQISVREFQLHASQYLNELPFTLTQYNVPIAIVSPILNEPPKNVLTGAEESSSEVLTHHRCEVSGGCKSYKTELVNGEGYDDEGNLREYKKWLCPFHTKTAK